MFRWILCVCIVGACTFAALPGCTDHKHTPGKKDDKGGAKAHPEHDEFGPHDGPLAEWEEIYHAEFTVDFATKKVIVYILDEKAKAAPKIDASKITKMKLTLLDEKPLVQIDLVHDAKLSGEKGIAFVGTHDALAKPRDIKGNISGSVEATPYSGDFSYKLPQKAARFDAPAARGVATWRSARTPHAT